MLVWTFGHAAMRKFAPSANGGTGVRLFGRLGANGGTYQGTRVFPGVGTRRLVRSVAPARPVARCAQGRPPAARSAVDPPSRCSQFGRRLCGRCVSGPSDSHSPLCEQPHRVRPFGGRQSAPRPSCTPVFRAGSDRAVRCRGSHSRRSDCERLRSVRSLSESCDSGCRTRPPGCIPVFFTPAKCNPDFGSC